MAAVTLYSANGHPLRVQDGSGGTGEDILYTVAAMTYQGDISGGFSPPMAVELGNAAPIPAAIDSSVSVIGQLVGGAVFLFDRQTSTLVAKRGTEKTEALATTTIPAGAGTATLATLENDNDYKGIALTFTLSGLVPATDIIAFTMKSAAANYYILLTSHLLNSDGDYTFRINPNLAAVHGLVANDQLTRQLVIDYTFSAAGDVDVTINANWFN